MSTKAYDFYKMNTKDLPSFLDKYKKDVLKKLFEYFMENAELKNLLLKRNWEEEGKIFKRIRDAISSPVRGEDYDFDVNCGISIWILGRKTLIKFFGENIRLNYKKYKLQNYEYWNNTDKPEEISSQDWNTRRRFYSDNFDNLHRMEYIPYKFTLYESGMTLHELREMFKKSAGVGK